MNDSWDDFKKLNTLTVEFAKSTARQATIFANGKNQVEVLVSISMQATDGKELNISIDELKNALYLCNYHTGNKLPLALEASYDEQEYNRAVTYQNVYLAGDKIKLSDNDIISSDSSQIGITYISFYLSCKALMDSYTIAVGINVPGVGAFDTTANGTETPNSPKGEKGSVFKNPKYVNVNFLVPINYSDPSNLQIETENFLQISDLFWESWFFPFGPYTEHWDGELKKKKVYIRPKTAISNNSFHIHNIICKPVRNEHCNKDKESWHGVVRDCFSVLYYNTTDFPSAVIGRGTGYDNYELNLWYSEKNHIEFDGYFNISDAAYHYRCQAKVDDNHLNDPDIGAAVLHLYKITIPENNCYQLGWEDAIHKSTLSVVDIYGNSGTTEIIFDDQNYFDLPHVRESNPLIVS